jgi:hypothetical protein
LSLRADERRVRMPSRSSHPVLHGSLVLGVTQALFTLRYAAPWLHGDH